MRLRSERVIAVSGNCIRTLARTLLKIQVSPQDARELALAHENLGDAIGSLQRSLTMHSTIGQSQTVLSLAIAEAKVGSVLIPEFSEEAVIDLRKHAFETMRGRSNVIEAERRRRLLLDVVTRDVRNWERDYEEFLTSLNDLFVRTCRRLEYLNLNSEKLSEAKTELEAILLAAIKRASSESG